MILDSLKWRYATKVFDPSKKLANSDVQTLIDAFRLTPTSFGLFPFELIIVENPQIREELVAHSWGQRQIADASHLFIVARRTDVDAAFIDKYVEKVAATRGITVESLQQYAGMMKGSLTGRTPEELATWTGKQAYIAMGNLLTVAAELKIDACPMEGFDPAAYDKILQLADMNLAALYAIPFGYRSADDKYASLPKVRWDEKDIVHRI